MRFREGQIHTDPDPDADPGPQHRFLPYSNLPVVMLERKIINGDPMALFCSGLSTPASPNRNTGQRCGKAG
jgi:hypothetical protein